MQSVIFLQSAESRKGGNLAPPLPLKLNPAWPRDLPSHQLFCWHWGHILVLYRLIDFENIWKFGIFLIPCCPLAKKKQMRSSWDLCTTVCILIEKQREMLQDSPNPCPILLLAFLVLWHIAFWNSLAKIWWKDQGLCTGRIILGPGSHSSHSGGASVC